MMGTRMSDVKKTLEERGTRYGEFHEQAWYAQGFKAIFQSSPNWLEMTDDQREGLDMIANKIARILNGDPDYTDSWHDMAGYATLVEKRIEERNKQKATEAYNQKVDNYLQEIEKEDRWFGGFTQRFSQDEVTYSAMSDVPVLVSSEVLGVHPQWPESEVDEVAPEVFRPIYF